MNLNEGQIALINLVTKVGIDSAIAIMDGIKNAKTIDDAINALKEAQKLTVTDFRRAAQS